MKHCKYCGAQLADDEAYCYFCGKPTETEEEIIEEKEEPSFSRYEYNYQNTYDEPRNGIALAGFIVAFFSPLIGLILSSIGLNKSKMMDGVGRKYAIAGIIISICNFIFTFMIYYLYIATYYGEE